MRLQITAALFLIVTANLMFGQGKNDQHWVATWTTAQPLGRNLQSRPPAPRVVPAQPAAGQAPGQPAAGNRPGGGGPQGINARGFNNQTIRMIVRTSIGGSRMRIRLSNAFGGAPVVVGAAHAALPVKGAEIIAESDKAITFSGKPGCTIAPGVVIYSDPIDFSVPKFGDVAVSLYLPGETGPPTSHNGFRTSYIGKEGDLTAQATIPEAVANPSYFWLAGVDVMAPADTQLIVTLGDSITEGTRSTPDENRSWPAALSARLLANKATAHFAVANVGIGGNRVLRDGSGASALARFDRDVLGQPGVKWLIMLEGINDIGRGTTVPEEIVTADELIGGFKQIIERAHTHGIKVIGATILPYEGANYAREAGEETRSAVNMWIRTSGAFDGVVDFEAATKDPANAKKLRADFDPGDHLHPNDAGYQAMADAVNLSIFTGKAASARK